MCTALYLGGACAVHARRGDLANGGSGYGAATTIEYYRKALAIVTALHPGVRFYLFSDEPQWLLDNLVPLMPKGSEYELCNQNGSDKGYLDLYAMAQCDYVISSIGSLGIYAALLSTRNQCLVMSRHRPWVSEALQNVIHIYDGRETETASSYVRMKKQIPERKQHGIWRQLVKTWLLLCRWLEIPA